MYTTQKVKLYPTPTQEAVLEEYLHECKFLYNKFLEDRKDAWETHRKSVTKLDQQTEITRLRHTNTRLGKIPVEVLRDANRRVDSAFTNFFRRCKLKKEGKLKGQVGYPRFKKHYDSFTVTNCANSIRGNKVKVVGIEKAIRCRGLQDYHGDIKRLTIRKIAGEWYARILVDTLTDKPASKEIKSEIGIDLGLKSAIADSNGNVTPAPKYYRKAHKKLRVANKSLSRKTKGSNRRKKAVIHLQKVHNKINNCRDNFLHHKSKELVGNHQLIVGEQLSVAGMAKSKRFSKSIYDAAWTRLTWMLTYKAEKAGGQYIEVSNYRNSQNCSDCGEYVPKDLWVRTHKCPKCGLVLDRDVNAAINILKKYHTENRGPAGARIALRSIRPEPPVPAQSEARSSKVYGVDAVCVN